MNPITHATVKRQRSKKKEGRRLKTTMKVAAPSVDPPGMSKPKRPPGMSKNPRGTNPPLRDPTQHELHNGPDRSQLPETVRNNSRSETVCKFCGVSYLVFSEIKDLEKRLQQAEDSLLEHRRKAQKFDVLQNKVHQLVSAQKAHQEKYEALKQRSSNLEACVYEKEEALGRAQTDNEAMRSKVSGVRAALARERVNVNNLKMKTIRTLGDLGTLMKSTEHEIGVVGTRLRREEELRTRAEKELESARALLVKESASRVEQEKNIQELKASLDLLENQWKDEVESLKKVQKKTIVELNERQEREMNEHQESSKQMLLAFEQKQREEILVMKQEIQSIRERCDRAEKETLAERFTSNEKEKKINELEKELNKLRSEGSASSKELQKQLEELRRQHERLKMIHEMDKKKMVMENDILKKQVLTLENQISKKSKEADDVKSQNKVLENKMKELLEQLKESQENLLSLQQSLGSTTNEMSSEKERMREEHKKELKKLHDKINELTNELSDTKGKMETAQRRFSTMEEKLSEMERRLKRTAGASATEIGVLKSKLAESHGIHQHLKEENLELKKKLLSKDDEAVTLLMEANLARERAERAASEAQEETKRLQLVVGTSEQTIAELRHELTMQRQENERLKVVDTTVSNGVNQETVDGIEMLEKHLIKLSEKLRTKNQQVEQLQAVIHRECIQRGRLMDELSELRGGLQT